MTWIILLIIVATLLFFAELVLLPGITFAAIGAFCCFVTAIAWAFVDHGTTAGFVTLGVSLAIIIVLTAIFLRRKTWDKLTLHTDIKESVTTNVSKVAIGTEGKTLSRLAPMGTVLIEGEIIEAKSLADFIDPHTRIIVIGVDNFSLIVKPL